MNGRDNLAERKALLIAQADLQRMQAAAAWRDARRIVSPPARPVGSRRVRSAMAMLMGVAVPVVGVGRLRRFVRGVSIAITIFRVIRGLRGR
jgi:hypothetical protein